MLFGWVKPTALYDSRAKFESPRCDEGTRVEVIAEIMSWLEGPDSAQSLLCMTGSSGAGKSALQQTIAEQCRKKEIPVATFRFSKDDPQRNNTLSIIPTIAYQLGLPRAHAALSNLIGASVADDPFLITKCLQTQLMSLIVDPINALRSSHVHSDKTHPYIILIDGVNECADARRQAELLTAIKECIVENDYRHFRVIISSRIGEAINSTMAPQGIWPAQIYHIHFTMDSTITDICRMSWKRLQTNAKGSKGSHRATLLQVATSDSERPPHWRQGRGGISRPSRQQRPSDIDLGPTSSTREGGRSRSVPPTTHLGSVYIYHPSPAQVITSLDFVNASPTLTPHTHPFQALYIHAHVTPEPAPSPTYSGLFNQEPEPESATTDGTTTTNDQYPPSPYDTESLIQSESPMTPNVIDTYWSQAPTTRKSAPHSNDYRMDPPESAPRLAQPQPIRPFAKNDEDSPLYTPAAFNLPSWLRNAPRSRSPSPTFLGDPRRTYVAERCASADGVVFGGRKEKKRRHTLQPDLLHPSLPGTPGPQRIATPDEFMRTRKRQKTAPGKCHDAEGLSPESLDID